MALDNYDIELVNDIFSELERRHLKINPEQNEKVAQLNLGLLKEPERSFDLQAFINSCKKS